MLWLSIYIDCKVRPYGESILRKFLKLDTILSCPFNGVDTHDLLAVHIISYL